MSQLPQHLNDLIHATVVMGVVICATVLGATHALDRNTVGNVYLAAVGYAAGRAGSGAVRSAMTRKGDPGVPNTNG